MIIAIVLAAAVPLAVGVLAGWDTDGFHPRHFVLGTAVGLAIVLAAARHAVPPPAGERMTDETRQDAAPSRGTTAAQESAEG